MLAFHRVSKRRGFDSRSVYFVMRINTEIGGDLPDQAA